MDRTFELYVKSKVRLKEAGFNLRKFVTNSEELRERIDKNERSASRSEKVQPNGHQIAKTPPADVHKVEEEDMTYSRSILGTPVVEDPCEQRILGTLWNFHKDNLMFDLTETASLARNVELTKRNVISTVSKFYDPLGVISPIVVQFKILFQELYKEKRYWDDPLEGSCKVNLADTSGATTSLETHNPPQMLLHWNRRGGHCEQASRVLLCLC